MTILIRKYPTAKVNTDDYHAYRVEILCFHTLMMPHHGLFLFGLLLAIQLLCAHCENEWDILIFTQRWPITACSQWLETNSHNTCAFPNDQGIWTIHGIWPTKPGTKGPVNCNKTWHFNDTALNPLKPELEQYWINIEKNTQLNSLWKHEWLKHGTCAASLQQLNNEYNYFKQGLVWIQQFNMQNILAKKNVVPSDQPYLIVQIFGAVKSVLGVNSVVQCVVDRHTKQELLSEIRICFNKSLQLVDCDGVKGNDYKRIGDVLTNCSRKKAIVYPNKNTPTPTSTSTTPETALDQSKSENSLDAFYRTRERLITLYRTIRLLIIATI